jgi:hypothetical protein
MKTVTTGKPVRKDFLVLENQSRIFTINSDSSSSSYFMAKNDLPVNLNLIIGNEVWLDDLSMVRELN